MVYMLSWCFRCKKCKGSRTVKEKKRLEIFIEKGMPNHHRIVLQGEGDQEVKSRPTLIRQQLILEFNSLKFHQGTLSLFCRRSPMTHSNVPEMTYSPPSKSHSPKPSLVSREYWSPIWMDEAFECPVRPGRLSGQKILSSWGEKACQYLNNLTRRVTCLLCWMWRCQRSSG